ncbi:hypothetical protein EBB59_07015 [Lysobacter pythonis]|uniref:Uncharacterized protein n=1 Tax=Solilutibacter pythonis TaxID=2483112 RepID=A0A3M2HZZ5_9GAMM|nr:hypothetical protein [Lysobacter pythonis]RMH92969.1 hypothetical protein EBB59_07015 [Lysobacter pythonis]
MNFPGTVGASEFDITIHRDSSFDPFADGELSVAFNCLGTFGCAGTFGTGTGCLGTAGCAGTFGCGGGEQPVITQ